MRVVIPNHCSRTMMERHFRGRGTRLAGNFSRWESPNQVLRDRSFSEIFHAVCYDILTELERNPPRYSSDYDQRFNIPFPGIVGWSGTAPRGYVNGAELELFDLNKHARGFKVMDSEPLAPVTRLVSCSTRFRFHEADPHNRVLMLYNLAPGPSVGELHGNVSLREDIVFFDFLHRGGENVHPADADFI
ncbi:hypothetical protein IT407_00505 [Candidatus Uhrbacteria bacterium]|nr:hypothetical protein [Candidatus Uhrbacteria bacterium]